MLVILAFLAAIAIPRLDAWLGLSTARRAAAGIESCVARAGAAGEATREGERGVEIVLTPAEGRGRILRGEEEILVYEWETDRVNYLGRAGDPPPGERVVLRVERDGLVAPVRWEIGGRLHAWRPFGRMLVEEGR